MVTNNESRTTCFMTLMSGEEFTYWVPINIETFRHNLAQASILKLVLPDGTEKDIMRYEIRAYTLIEH